MAKTVFVTDLDGTFMRDDKTISKYSIDLCNRLIREGICITYATARSQSSATQITKGIDFELPVICRNGTVLWDTREKKDIWNATFESSDVIPILEAVKKYQIPGFVTSHLNGREVKLYVADRMNPGFRSYLQAHTEDRRLAPVQTDTELFQGEISYFTFIAEKDELEPMVEQIRGDERWNCIFQQDKYRGEYWLEICPREATKAQAILKIKERYHCDKIVVFGDSMNDISMFEIADESYAVANSCEELKKMATHVIGSNNEDCVIRQIEKMTRTGKEKI